MLFDKLQDKIKATSFSSVSDYVTYILREILSESELSKGSKQSSEEKGKQGLVERLRKMGYI